MALRVSTITVATWICKQGLNQRNPACNHKILNSQQQLALDMKQPKLGSLFPNIRKPIHPIVDHNMRRRGHVRLSESIGIAATLVYSRHKIHYFA